MAYLDTSALVKLVVVEAETSALREELRRWSERVSSLLAAVELSRVASRLGGLAVPAAARLLSDLRLLSMDRIATEAALIGSPLLRSLDAIHLATAKQLGAEMGVLITYDRRMLADAGTLGIPFASPR